MTSKNRALRVQVAVTRQRCVIVVLQTIDKVKIARTARLREESKVIHIAQTLNSPEAVLGVCGIGLYYHCQIVLF
jgi:hypothetical protein